MKATHLSPRHGASLIASLALLAVAATGCGGGGVVSDEDLRKSIAKAATDYKNAQGADNYMLKKDYEFSAENITCGAIPEPSLGATVDCQVVATDIDGASYDYSITVEFQDDEGTWSGRTGYQNSIEWSGVA